MEKIKKEIINLLGENARYTYAQMANIIGATSSEVENAVKELEKDGVIVKYAAIINTEAVENKKTQALIEVKVAPQTLKGFDSYAEEIYSFPEVVSLYLMSGGFDLAVFVEGDGITDIARFISEKLSVIDGIVSVQTHFILKKYKIEGQVTKPTEECKRQIIQV
ncbi:MAG: Lrp/AsnC family transcriptional regulator [Clostridia bacterium]|nr:Lrp/AsnC family transcriptional regulator [Clostridia bacterium]